MNKKKTDGVKACVRAPDVDSVPPAARKALSTCPECTRKHLSCAISYLLNAVAHADALPNRAHLEATPRDQVLEKLRFQAGVNWARSRILLTESLQHGAVGFLPLAVHAMTEYLDAAEPLAKASDIKEFYDPILDRTRLSAVRLARTLLLGTAWDDGEDCQRDTFEALVPLHLENIYSPEVDPRTAVYMAAAHLLEATRERPEDLGVTSYSLLYVYRELSTLDLVGFYTTAEELHGFLQTQLVELYSVLKYTTQPREEDNETETP